MDKPIIRDKDGYVPIELILKAMEDMWTEYDEEKEMTKLLENLRRQGKI